MTSTPNDLETSREGVALLAVACAAQAARDGRTAESEAALVGLTPELRGRAPVLDLRARLAAQGGRYAEAQALWAEAQRLDPANAAYAAGQRRARRAERQVWWRVPWLWPGLVVLVLVLLAGGLLRSGGRVSPQPVASAPPQPAAASVALPPQAPPVLRLAAPGLSSRPDAATLVVTFDAGLFAGGTRLTPAGVEALRLLASALETRARQGGGPLDVTLVGHTDERPMPPGRRYRDNAALGLARAAVVCEHLQSSALPASAFSLTSAGLEPPAASSSHATPASRRTVVVRLRGATARP